MVWHVRRLKAKVNCAKTLGEIVQMRLSSTNKQDGGSVVDQYSGYFCGHDCAHLSNTEALKLASVLLEPPRVVPT